MSGDCQAIQESLVELSGALHQLTVEEQQHLTACPECGGVAEAERELNQLLSAAVPAQDTELVEQIVESLPSPSRWRRAVAFIPVAVSFLVVAAGALLVGGLPGSSFLPLLPIYSTQGWLSLTQVLLDWSVVLLTLSQAFQVELAPVARIAGLISFAGLTGMTVAMFRNRKTRRWPETG
jgi:predicted anti-sigma-YlaC factor YlaD